MTTNPDETSAPAALEPTPATATAIAAAIAAAPALEDFAGEIKVANGPMPLWFRRLPYVTILAALAYYLYVKAFDPVNLAFAALFIAWMIYTPIAQKRGWFFIPM